MDPFDPPADPEQAAQGGPERDVARRIEAGNGNYWRDPEGVWRYFWDDGRSDPVPEAFDVYDEGGRLVDLMAPELAPSRLLDAKAVSRLCGWSVDAAGKSATLSTHLSNGRMVRPVLRLGRAGGAWSLPIVRWFLEHRPFRDADWYPPESR